jgi:hypothetical protein
MFDQVDAMDVQIDETPTPAPQQTTCMILQ